MITEDEMQGKTYWHFLRKDRCLRFGDNREVFPGMTLRTDDAPILREQGFHASERVIDALIYAPGPVVCLVTLGGAVVHTPDRLVPDKSAGQERTALWMYDATDLLRGFACDVAEEALLGERSLGREPDPRSFAAIKVMRQCLATTPNGRNTSDRKEDFEERQTAWANATEAANSATNRAAREESQSGMFCAAQSASTSVSPISATSAARSAALLAAESSARSWNTSIADTMSVFGNRLTKLLMAAMARGEGRFAPVEAELPAVLLSEG